MIYIPEQLRRRIELHLLRNLAAGSLGHVPLILGIEGAPGNGKTRAVDEVCRENGVKPFVISGDQLESPNAGFPAQLIRNRYREAGDFRSKGLLGAALVVNDIDVAIGNWGDGVQYTMNRQMVTESFMHLCDFPTLVEGYDVPNRVPIIFTGNNFSLLHGPLLRSGRFDYLHWAPTTEDKIRMIEGILGAQHINLCETLVRLHPSEPVSFFQDAISLAQSEAINKLLDDTTLKDCLTRVANGSAPRVPHATPEQIIASAETLANGRAVLNGATNGSVR